MAIDTVAVRLGLVLAGVCTAVLACVVGGSAAVADSPKPAPPSVRWAVTPADGAGPDQRASIEHEIAPGATVDDFIAVRNVGPADATFALAAADGFFTRAGRFDVLPSDQRSVDSGTWITVQESVTVPAGGTVVVPFSVAVPDLAEPGDHAAGITASVRSVQSTDGGTAVGVESRVGVKVMTRVTGGLDPSALVLSFTGSYSTSWNPFRPGELTVSFDVVNTGNTRLWARGWVTVAGRRIASPSASESAQELLPGDTRPIRVVIDDVWPWFLTPVDLSLDADSLARDGSSPDVAEVTARTVVVTMPWPQLMLVLGAALVVTALVWGRARSRRRLGRMLDEARAEGARSAGVDGRVHAVTERED